MIEDDVEAEIREAYEMRDQWPIDPDKVERLIAEVRRLRDLVFKHHDVALTGHVEGWGRLCPVCEQHDPEIRAKLNELQRAPRG
jgi:hypothetical protein